MTNWKCIDRRSFVRWFLVGAGMLGTQRLLRSRDHHPFVWQLDPSKCIQCGRCATACVLTPSAVKCVHTFAMCGYCDLCSGYYVQDATNLDTGAENQLCPTSAIERKFIEDPYFQYTINRDLCLGCARCVKSCGAFGNGSLSLQIQHDICVNCNKCAIAKVCPADAFTRVPRNRPYLVQPKEKEVAT